MENSNESKNLSYKIRQMIPDDVEREILPFNRDLNWTVGKFDYQNLMKIDPQGFLVAEDNKTGRKFISKFIFFNILLQKISLIL